LHQFLQQYYQEGVGLDQAALAQLAEYENSIYEWV
jgi:hypothetical protein